VIALDAHGSYEVVVTVRSFPMCIDFLPDGRLLVVDSAQRRLLRREPDGSLVQHADLSGISEKPWNDIVIDDRGNAYVNTIGFDFPGGEFAPGLVVLVTPEGNVGQVADDLAFPNGMAISPDGATLVVAESYANRLTAYDIGSDGGLGNRRVWAETPGDHPDGICMDAEDAIWYADVGNQHCVRVREGGEVLATVGLDRGAFACALSRCGDPRCSSLARPGEDPGLRNLPGGSWRSRRPRRAPGDLDPGRSGTASARSASRSLSKAAAAGPVTTNPTQPSSHPACDQGERSQPSLSRPACHSPHGNVRQAGTGAQIRCYTGDRRSDHYPSAV
jgi:hypothetical protein